MRLRGTVRQVRPRLKYPNEPARQIYAYRNVQTNQVLYSVSRILRPSALDQLPDLGANKKPVSIRPDLWRPFFVVHFPDTPQAEAQCQYAYERLLHYRKLHEYYWERPAELEIRYNEGQIGHITDQLGQRGGSKKDNPYDLIKRYNKHLKISAIMDQKANSVADLAASISDLQQTWEFKNRRVSVEIRKRVAEVRILKTLATTRKSGNLVELQEERDALRRKIPTIVYQESPEYIAVRKQYREAEQKYSIYQKRGTRKELREQLRRQMGELSQRMSALKPISKHSVQRELRAVEQKLERMNSAVAAERKAREELQKMKSAFEAERSQQSNGKGLPETWEGPQTWTDVLSNTLRAETPPVWDLETHGRIQVKWVDTRDATFARQWPEDVVEFDEWDVTKADLQRPPRITTRPRRSRKPTDVTSVAARQLWKMIQERGANNPERSLRRTTGDSRPLSVGSGGQIEKEQLQPVPDNS